MEFTFLILLVLVAYFVVGSMRDESGAASNKKSRRNSRPNSSHRD